VWLDRGELDKIIQRSALYTQQPDIETGREQKPYRTLQPYGGQQSHYNDPNYKHKKKKGFLSDFFDFD
jgi:Zn-finger nucleic acid-binding protein